MSTRGGFIPKGPKRYPHQRDGLRRLIKQRGVGALLFDPGLGKTATVLDYASALALRSGQQVRVLVTCPLVAVDTWVDQSAQYVHDGVGLWAEALGGSIKHRCEAMAARNGQLQKRRLTDGKLKRGQTRRALHVQRAIDWTGRGAGQPDHSADPALGPQWVDQVGSGSVVVLVANLETFSTRADHGSKTMADVILDAVQRYEPHIVVVDEAHRIKGAGSNTSRLLARVGKKVKRRIILTGTVMPHSPLDVYSQWSFLNPETFSTRLPNGGRRPMSLSRFTDRYGIYGGWMGRQIVGYRNLDEMKDRMLELAVVAKKEDALDLPETSDVVIPAKLSPMEQHQYDRMKDDLAVVLSSGSAGSVAVTSRLTQMIRLRQLSCGFMPDEDGTIIEVGNSRTSIIRSLVQDTLAQEKRIVIFSAFIPEIERIAAALDVKGTRVDVVTGETPASTRIEIRQRFGSASDERIVIVAQIRTMSLSVNELVTASHAIFASMSLQRDEYVQARDRLNRIGQTRPVTFWHVIPKGTVDEVVMRSHQQRTDLEAALLDYVADK